MSEPASDIRLPPASNDRPYVSLVIPCYNEEENVAELLRRVSEAMASTGRPFEVLIVDDG